MSEKEELFLSSGETGVSLDWDSRSAPLGEGEGDEREFLDTKVDSTKS